ncbi:MAG: Kae1-associated kinase Bud32 [Candidatus Geothermarchaeales archaeon]
MEGEFALGIWPDRILLCRGAEAEIYKIRFLGEDSVLKIRRQKRYRNPELDRKTRTSRTLREASALKKAKELGVPAPFVRYVDAQSALIVMQFVRGSLCRDALVGGSLEWSWAARELGREVARLHNGQLVHGDLTTSNVIVDEDRLVLFDFGLSEIDPGVEGKAVDIELLYRVLHSTHPQIEKGFMGEFLREYESASESGGTVVKRFNAIRRMGRYVARESRAKS